MQALLNRPPASPPPAFISRTCIVDVNALIVCRAALPCAQMYMVSSLNCTERGSLSINEWHECRAFAVQSGMQVPLPQFRAALHAALQHVGML